MKKTLILGIAAAMAIIAPFLALLLGTLLAPPVYDGTFVGALADKYERLYSIDQPKLIVVGGSSVAFGLDSEELEARVGMPVVNFGLYATLGSKIMLDLSRDAIGEGDIIVFAPETDPQAWSLYFSGRTTLEALDADYSMLSGVDRDDLPSLWGQLWSHACSKLAYLIKGKPDMKDSIYQRSSFNDYGDIVYPRPEPIGALKRAGYDKNKLITLDGSILSDDFVEYLNDYIAFAKKRGATVLLSFSPMNRLAVERNYRTGTGEEKVPVNTAESISAFAETLRERIDCPLISDPADYIMDYRLFYDSNFHLTDEGAALRTAQLAKDLTPYLSN